MNSVDSPSSAPVDLVGCTVISKNYLSYARVLAESFMALHPGCPFYVLLCDRLDGAFDPSLEPFKMIEVETLNIPGFTQMAFRYNVIELDTAVKPFFFQYLIREKGSQKLVYFDPDILICAPLHTVSALLDAHDIVLTPHMTSPIDDGKLPSEQTIMLSGMYNLGFLAMRDSPDTSKLLDWWGKRLRDKCYIRQEQGLFVDQKWMDFAPSYCRNHIILHDHGHNVAFWNLHERVIGKKDDQWTVNGQPLIFYHFSGFNPLQPDKISKHQTRVFFEEREAALKELFDHYRTLQLAHGYEQTHGLPYAYGYFENGVSIGKAVRTVYARHIERFPDAFKVGPGSFYAWLLEGTWKTGDGKTLNHLHEELYDIQPNLRAHFPHPTLDADRYAMWLLHPSRMDDWEIESVFLESLQPESEISSPIRAERKITYVQKILRARHQSPAYQAFIRMLKKLIGVHVFYRLKLIIVPGPVPYIERQHAHHPIAIRRMGVNVSGYIRGELGLGEAVRGHVYALQTAEVPFALHNVQFSASRQEDHRFDALITDEQPYDMNLIEVNVDLLPLFKETMGNTYMAERYNIGAWMWELPDFPTQWHNRFGMLQEIWAGSSFCRDVFAEVSPVPVIHMPYVVECPATSSDRAHFGIPQDRFVFLYMFDFFSVFERKNPLAAIAAFRRAFTHNEPVTLVIKSSNGTQCPDDYRVLQHAAGDDPRIILMDRYLTSAEKNMLIASCDAYVSPHRSEGFGLTVAEALFHGKPVIATNFSGTRDFLNADTGFPVSYSLMTLTQDAGPYTKGNRWADPDIEHFSVLMRRVYEHPEEARTKAANGAALMRADFSARAIGERMHNRLKYIAQFSRAA